MPLLCLADLFKELLDITQYFSQILRIHDKLRMTC